MAKPYYAGSYKNRGRNRGKIVFFVIVLIQFALVGAYFHFRSKKAAPEGGETPPPALPAPASAEPQAPAPAAAYVPTAQSQAALSDARAAIDAGQLLDAQATLERLANAPNPDPEAIKLLGDVNMKLLKSSVMTPYKKYYVIQAGDYLQKIARKFHTTVPLIKAMNGMQSDTIRLGDRLLVLNGTFSIRVSKSRNTLDLLLNGKLFKRYSVGTGKFGKTPAVTFTIVDKIIEPPWTRPSDNKRIEYGDPENVLGSRWMAIKSADHPELTGFGIHGTWQRDSIGKQSSAGCIRMLNEDVEELFDLVPRKTSVTITE